MLPLGWPPIQLERDMKQHWHFPVVCEVPSTFLEVQFLLVPAALPNKPWGGGSSSPYIQLGHVSCDRHTAAGSLEEGVLKLEMGHDVLGGPTVNSKQILAGDPAGSHHSALTLGHSGCTSPLS